MRIALLGSMVVAERGDLQLRDRTVLGVLLVRAGSVVTADELAAALWGDEPPASYRKVIQGSVVRLRRELGQDGIRTTTAGYSLGLAETETDVGRFELLVTDARAQLESGYGERAARTAREALALWRGDPLPELVGWPPAEAEAARLVGLRESAEDLLIGGVLQAGQAEAAATTAASLAEAAPYREPRWALWARALYAAGRQADALHVLARLRTTLADDLGIDPGPDVAALEVAILRQDPALNVRPALASDAACPWPGLLAYQSGDAIFGRDRDIASAADRLLQSGVLVVVGRSGVGKSSFVRAGLTPRLSAVVITPGPHPVKLLAAVSSPDVVVDQAEELLCQCDTEAERIEFLSRLATWPGRVVVVVRADLLDELACYDGFATLLERGLFVLRPLDEHAMRSIVEAPAEVVGLRLEPGLVDLLLSECRNEPGALPLLSHVLAQTWQHVEGNTLTVAGYLATGGIKHALSSTAEQVYLSYSPTGREEMRRLFRRLVSEEDGQIVRSRVPSGDFSPALVEGLLSARLVGTADGGGLQVAHEALTRHWPRLNEWLRDDVASQRLLRRLAAETLDWEAQGRTRDSLFRGVRLDSALSWATSHDAELSASERAFLDASREAAEGELLRSRRTNSRLRIALAAAGALLIAAVGGVAYAVHQEVQATVARDTAEKATSVSEGLRLGAVAEVQENPAVAFGLAAEALAIDESEATRTRVLETFGNFTSLMATGEAPPADWPAEGHDVTSPDRMLRAVTTPTAVVVSDADTGAILHRLVTPISLPTALAFSPDGRLLAAGMSELGFPATGTTVVWSIQTGSEVGRFDSGEGIVRAHVFAPDGSSVWSEGQDGIHHWDLTSSRALARTGSGDPMTYRAGDLVLSLWDESVAPWIEQACALAGRSLTSVEWREYVGDRPYRPTCR